jgi:2-haloacid dehalogenase/putative hydrolase of the HAD superfamily
MVRAITFDAFGTVIDTGREVLIEIARDVCREYRSGLEAEAFLDAWDRHFFGASTEPFLTVAELSEDSLARAFQEYGIDADPGPFVDRLEALWLRSKAYPEVLGALEALDGFPRAIVSNADDAFLKQILERNRLRFDAIVTSEAARTYKPRPRIFEIALEALRASPSDVVHVGDSLEADIAGASRLGMRTVWVNRPGVRRGPGDPAPDAEMRDLSDLPRVVHGLGPPSARKRDGKAHD